MKTLGLIFPDQLSENNPILDSTKRDLHVLYFEPLDIYFDQNHHKQKLAFLFSSLRHFIKELDLNNADHIPITKGQKNGMTDLLSEYISLNNYEVLEVVHPSDHKTLTQLTLLTSKLGIALKVHDDPKFISNADEFKNWAEGKKSLVQEFFYRWLRKKYNILIEDGKPVGGEWNFDSKNRVSINKLKEDPPKREKIKPDALSVDVMVDVENVFGNNFGDLENFNWSVTREDAERKANEFFNSLINNFGPFQDAMDRGNPTLFHSLLSPYINVGLLDPMKIIVAAEKKYYEGAPLNSVEGFIRQILGWREFIRGIYWLKMPDYKSLNFFENTRKLPELFWTGETRMQCVAKAVESTKELGYSHHIHRLMVTGNFALLSEIDPRYVCEWYLGVYLDAHEWVELPNTLGMALFADGGIVGTKPYAASGAYINRMSNYCKTCHYNVKETTSNDACPFNYLYWNFLNNQRKKLENNPRMKLVYRNLNNKDDEFIRAVNLNSEDFFTRIKKGSD